MLHRYSKDWLENYDFWKIKMTTVFKSQGLWDLVDKGTPDPNPNPGETNKRDAKALMLIQQGMDDSIFPKIASCSTAKEAWDILQTSFQGSAKVMTVKTIQEQMTTGRGRSTTTTPLANNVDAALAKTAIRG